MMRRLRRLILGISPEETTLARRGFRATSPTVGQRLEEIGTTFVTGYHFALEEDRSEPLSRSLRQKVKPELQGFAFEGAAMALTLLDLLLPWRRTRLQTFIQGPAADHIYMANVGAGWAFARLHRRPRKFLAKLDPLICWLAADGYGFHEGYFSWRRSIEARKVPRGFQGYEGRAFDQGLGRSLWFVAGADTTEIERRIDAFPPGRRPDLWSGIGLAACYAGGVGADLLKTVRRASGDLWPHLAQGVAFAAKARQKAKISNKQTEVACRILCDHSVDEAVRASDQAMEDLPETGIDAPQPAYEVWRTKLRSHFSAGRVREHRLQR